MNQSSKKAVPKPEHMTALANYIATHAPNDWRYGYVFAHHDFETGALDIEPEYELSNGSKAYSKTMTVDFVGLVAAIRQDFLDNDMEGWEEMSLKLSNKGEVELDFKYKKTS